MSGFFCFQQQTYHDNVLTINLSLLPGSLYRDTATEALREQQALEGRLVRLKSQNEPQRKTGAKANTIDVARKLISAVLTVNKQINIIYKDNINLEQIAIDQEKNGVNRLYFEEIYLANEETLSSQFKHITTDDLNRVKRSLLERLSFFDKNFLQKESSGVRKELDKAGKLKACQKVIQQTIRMIACAKTLSAVLATVAVEADLLAQLSLAKDKDTFFDRGVNSVADLFIDWLPAALSETLQRATFGSSLNRIGSAFQLEKARELFISKLERYLASRAQLENCTHDDRQVTYRYRPMNKGIFFNKPLQEARIEVAATLLAELKAMQLSGKDKDNHKEAISHPQFFAVALAHATETNNTCYSKLARTLPGGIFIDGEGELAVILEEMRQEMKSIYPYDVRINRSGAGLYDQLGLTTTSPQLQ
ncbi:hypothetical protein [Legionella jamestowniensis]|uniref:Uncharacterized protein n=1 Tax=Legionella jamestowniensis TaxID=455 RepID=A0A0W0UJP9_9GAMM|nr:hypothetical protein [Legionella jamestowniensis]KTD07948.1 hypothetical protein Ljam_2143 [Legionella jamestowniensis]OCH99081.1 hypothetical protein A8135_10085 [Legionella jamestowniensis]SFL64508.1 hypothetical protein SAMN02746073_1269 [Legionella jamestowniensis DSM 19215]